MSKGKKTYSFDASVLSEVIANDFIIDQQEIFIVYILNDIKVRVSFGKIVAKKHLRRHDKNYNYFWKTNIPVINFILDFRNMIKFSKNVAL